MLRSIIGTLLAVLVLSGCASVYPIKNDNMLQAPIQFSYQHVSEPTLSKDDVIAKVNLLLKDKGLMADKFVAQAVEKKVPLEYDAIIKTQPTNELDYFSRIFQTALSGNGYGNSPDNLFTAKYGRPRFQYNQVGLIPLADNGFELRERLAARNFSYVISSSAFTSNVVLNATITGSLLSKDGVISGSITKIGYQLDSNMVLDNGHVGRGDVVENVVVNEKALTERITQLSSFAKQLEINVVSVLSSRMENMANHRYSLITGVNPDKVEKNYHIDFATAKARLQRALGEFKYDNSQSAFTFDKQFSKNKLTVNHKYTISLFPDRENTVVQFFGDYSYLKDALDGPDVFGSDSYHEEMQKYIEKIASLLK